MSKSKFEQGLQALQALTPDDLDPVEYIRKIRGDPSPWRPMSEAPKDGSEMVIAYEIELDDDEGMAVLVTEGAWHVGLWYTDHIMEHRIRGVLAWQPMPTLDELRAVSS